MIGAIVSKNPKGAVEHVNPNKLNHIFGQVRHGLDGLVKSYGSPEKAYGAILRATEAAVKEQGVTGVFREVQVTVNKQIINVSGKVVDGAVKIGTAFIKEK